MPNVLLVDDERMSNRLIQMSLELDGFQVQIAHTLDQARSKLTNAIQGILIDYHLPQNTKGVELIEEIRTGQTDARTDTIVILASGDDRRKKEALEYGADHFLLKPFSPADLATMFQDMIAEKGL